VIIIVYSINTNLVLKYLIFHEILREYIYIYMYGEEEHVRVKSDMFNDSIYLFVVKFKIVMSIVLCSIKLRRSRINLEHWIPKLNLCWPGKSATKCKLSRTSSW